MARIEEIVKAYKLINDPNAPHWSVRFVGGLAIGALIVAGGATLVWATMHDQGPAPNVLASTSAANGDGTRTDRIFLSHFDAALAPDYDALQSSLDAWHAQHPDAQVLRETPIRDSTQVHTIGYEIRYR